MLKEDALPSIFEHRNYVSVKRRLCSEERVNKKQKTEVSESEVAYSTHLFRGGGGYTKDFVLILID